MRKRIKDLSNEFEETLKLRGITDHHILEEEILEECKKKINQDNKAFIEEKLKYYKKFKNSKTGSNENLKKVLKLRSHSKKVRKRGRKCKKKLNLSLNSTNEKNNVVESPNLIKHIQTSQNISTSPNFKISEKKLENSTFKDFNFNYPSAFSSKIHNSLTLVTPEKTRENFTTNLKDKKDDLNKNKSVISFNSLKNVSTYDKSKR